MMNVAQGLVFYPLKNDQIRRTLQKLMGDFRVEYDRLTDNGEIMMNRVDRMRQDILTRRKRRKMR